MTPMPPHCRVHMTDGGYYATPAGSGTAIAAAKRDGRDEYETLDMYGAATWIYLDYVTAITEWTAEKIAARVAELAEGAP